MTAQKHTKIRKALTLILVLIAVSILNPFRGELNAEQYTFNIEPLVKTDSIDYPIGGYDAKTKTWTSGVVTDRHAGRYADDFSEGYNGLSVAIVAGRENIDYAVDVGEKIKKGLLEKNIQFAYFITEHGENGFGARVYSNGTPSSDAFTVDDLYVRVSLLAYHYEKDKPKK